ncbi:hypothetical protein F5Y10DRAFT_292747 [Nemania abortiva]|nr:hypothetical protein F5Y10DRAFT_292747 [Nemania abortiva]
MDDPLPERISTADKQCSLARSVAMRRYNRPVISSKLVSLQGTDSITLEVAMQDHPDVIVQFRAESFDITPFKIARKLLGSAVPSIEIFNDDEDGGFRCVLMSKMAGGTWFDIEDIWKENNFIKSATGLGEVMSHCFVPSDNRSIEGHIIPRLQGILTMETRCGINVTRYFPLVRDLITASERLGDLPSFFSHPDLNPMNIFVSKCGDLEGLIDWDGSLVLPFGVSSWAIHFLAGQFLTMDDGEIGFVERPFYERIERAFWEALIKNAPEELVDQPHNKMELLQLAVIVGTVIGVLGIDDENGTQISDLHVPSLRALPRLLRYRIPFVRGATETPFGASEYQIQLD